MNSTQNSIAQAMDANYDEQEKYYQQMKGGRPGVDRERRLSNVADSVTGFYKNDRDG